MLGGGLSRAPAALDEARKLGGCVDSRHGAAGLQRSRGHVSHGERGSRCEELKAEQFL